MTEHRILMVADTRSESYGITYRSAFVYRTTTSHSPTRIVEWTNVNRINPRDREKVRHSEYGPIDGGCGKYLDPHNNATDSTTSWLLTTESTIIDNRGTSTGQPGSGQLFDPFSRDVRIAHGDTLVLVYPDVTLSPELTVVFSNNGHGDAVLSVAS